MSKNNHSGTPYKLGYARVSTLDQNPELQTDALEKAGCQKIFVEKMSGAKTDRPELRKVLEQLRPGDTLVVWKLDRLGRNLKDLINIINDLNERGINFGSVTEGMDTGTVMGKLIFHLFGALAEFEREIIRERVQAGLTAARARGRMGGRPTVMTPKKLAMARQMYKGGTIVKDIAETLGVSQATVQRHLRKSRLRSSSG